MEILKFILASVISATVLIVLAKVVMQKYIRKPYDYYLNEEDRQEDAMLSKVETINGGK